MFGKIKKLYGIAIAVTAVLALAAFALVWFSAPSVGGDWWPYIRFVVSGVAMLVIARVAWTVTWVLLVWKYGKELIFGKGSEDDPWDEEDIEEFMGGFQ